MAACMVANASIGAAILYIFVSAGRVRLLQSSPPIGMHCTVHHVDRHNSSLEGNIFCSTDYNIAAEAAGGISY